MKSEELSSFIMNTIMSCADAETATIIIMEELAERQVNNLDKADVSVSLRDEASCLTCLYGNKDTNSHPCINCRDKNLWRKQ